MEKAIRAALPKVGQIYRDVRDRSFIVLGKSDRIFVEYADGRLKRLQQKEWDKLDPHVAAF